MKSPSWEKRFLTALANTANVRASCQAANVSRDYVYKRRRNNKAFAAAWAEALEDACDVLEAKARQRALSGESDTLLIFLLKAHRPEKFRDTVTHRGDAAAPLEIKAEVKNTHEFDEAGFQAALDGFFDELASKARAGQSVDTGSA